jgi:hypothetical protein
MTRVLPIFTILYVFGDKENSSRLLFSGYRAKYNLEKTKNCLVGESEEGKRVPLGAQNEGMKKTEVAQPCALHLSRIGN